MFDFIENNNERNSEWFVNIKVADSYVDYSIVQVIASLSSERWSFVCLCYYINVFIVPVNNII